MITNLKLTNFRGYKKYEIPFAPRTVIVGKNNAGKSTALEALRVASLVVERYQNLTYHSVPRWLEIAKVNRGVSPSLRNFEVTAGTLFHKLSEPPAEIEVEFDTKESITIYLGEDEAIYAVIRNSTGQVITSKSAAHGMELPNVRILPQIGPLQREETILDPDYVRRAASTSLASMHFRNQLHLASKPTFERFSALVQDSWPGLRIRKLDSGTGLPGEKLFLMVHDSGFEAEASWLGHGLQMWLQIMWFLANVERDSTIILDEPDVYMHIELQRKLIRTLKAGYKQMILSSHSTEILTEVTPDEVVIIDRRRKRSEFASSVPAVQAISDSLGGISSIQLMRLWGSKKLLLVEGKDLGMLKLFQDVSNPSATEPIDSVFSSSYGGWGGWSYVVGAALLLTNAGGENITTYCLMDCDYHTEEEISDRYKEALEKHVELHIWSQKEIENYFIVPSAIRRTIAVGVAGVDPPSISEVENQIGNVCDTLENQTFDSLSTAFRHQYRSQGEKGNSYARQKLQSTQSSLASRIAIHCGKDIMAGLSKWSQDVYGVSLNAAKIAKHLLPNEVASEMREVIEAITNSGPFQVVG